MFHSERGFVPIDEIESEKIRLNIDTPAFIDRKNLRIHQGRVEGLMGLGGIAHLRVETFESDRVSEYTQIVGTNESGEAYSVKRGSFSKNNQELKLVQERKEGSPEEKVTAKIDLQTLNSGVGENVRSVKLWSNEIDKAVKNGIRESAKKALVTDNIKAEKIAIGIQAGFQTLYAFLGTPPEERFFQYGSLLFMQQTFKFLMYDSQARLSVLPGPQLDRLALLQIRTRFQKVAKGFEGRK